MQFNSVHVWLRGETLPTHGQHHQKRFWLVWLSTKTPPPSRFSSVESIFREAAPPSFLKSSLPTLETHNINLSLLPLNLITFFHIPFYIWKNPSEIHYSIFLLIEVCWFFVLLWIIIFWLLQKSKGWRWHCLRKAWYLVCFLITGPSQSLS